MLLLLALAGFTACGDDETDIPNEPLTGTVAGEPWNYKFGNATLFTGDFKYRFLFLSDLEIGEDPCTIVNSTNPYIQVILPLQTGSYSLPLTPPQENLRFIYGDGTVLSAASGFIEVFAIDQARIVGYIQAEIDDDNSVEGRFVVEICS
jgi:hypothetical protein